jgi:hypothetical protein
LTYLLCAITLARIGKNIRTLALTLNQRRYTMAKKKMVLKKLCLRDVTLFKLANRRGFAAIARNNLTEGRTPQQTYSRLIKAVRRDGYELPDHRMPSITKNV